ncbi:MAG: S8/S53 family peptidase [Cyclobacteriaceae bacterium]
MSTEQRISFLGYIFTVRKPIVATGGDDIVSDLNKLFKQALGDDWYVEPINSYLEVFRARPTVIDNRDYGSENVKKRWEERIKVLDADKEDLIDNDIIPDFQYYEESGFPNPCRQDTNLETDWVLDNMKVKEAWSLKSPSGKSQGEGIRVGHIDSGYSAHYELFDNQNFKYRLGKRDNIFGEKDWDVIFADTGPTGGMLGDTKGHGTGTASAIIGGSQKRSRIAGIAPKAELVPIASSDWVLVKPSNLITGIEHAIATNCHVVSMSIGWLASSPAVFIADNILRKAVYEYGIIPVAAAGQPNSIFQAIGTFSYPGRSEYVIACSAHGPEGAPWESNIKGKHVKVSAPGESVFSAKYSFDSNNGTQKAPVGLHGIEQSCGTSFGTAHMAGIAANWLSFCGRDKLIEKYQMNLYQTFIYDIYHHGLDKSKDTKLNKPWSEHEEKGNGWGRIDLYSLLKSRENIDDWPELEEILTFYNEITLENTLERFIEDVINKFVPYKISLEILKIIFRLVDDIATLVEAIMAILFFVDGGAALISKIENEKDATKRKGYILQLKEALQPHVSKRLLDSIVV